MYGALHPKSHVDRLYLKKKEGGRGLMSVERCVREEENSLGFYVANSEENLINGVAAAETINTEDTVTSGEFKKQRAQELKQSWHEKKKDGQFIREMQFVGTKYVKHHIDKTNEIPLCISCGKKGERVHHLVSGCEELAQKE